MTNRFKSLKNPIPIGLNENYNNNDISIAKLVALKNLATNYCPPSPKRWCPVLE